MLTTEQLRKRDRNKRWGAMYRTALSTIIAGAVLGSGSLLLKLNDSSTRMETRMSGIEAQLPGTYAAKDAQRDVSDIMGTIGRVTTIVEARGPILDANSKKLDHIDARLREIERSDREQWRIIKKAHSQ